MVGGGEVETKKSQQMKTKKKLLGSSIKYVRTEGEGGGLGRCVRIAYTGGGGGVRAAAYVRIFLNIQQMYLYLINIIL